MNDRETLNQVYRLVQRQLDQHTRYIQNERQKPHAKQDHTRIQASKDARHQWAQIQYRVIAFAESLDAIDDNDDDVMTKEEIEADIKAYEQEYGFSSEELLDMRSRGEAPDTFDIGMWLLLLKYRD